jgi:cysteinyl-tRNA synthetase
VDLAFPHHENEIAQAEGITGKQFVRYWLHAEHLFVEGQKMSKSLGNFYTLRDLLEMGHSPDTIRYLLSGHPYRNKLNFTFDGLKAASSALERLRNFEWRLKSERFGEGENPKINARIEEARRDFDESMDDDLNTAGALGAVFELVRDLNSAMDSGEFLAANATAAMEFLGHFDAIFDVLRPVEVAGQIEAEEIERLIEERLSARKAKNFKRSDEIRDDLAARGVILEDTKEGTRWKRK